MSRKTTPARPPAKKPYRKPQLIVHGNLKNLTSFKGGGSFDGSGKPQTKAGGGNG